MRASFFSQVKGRLVPMLVGSMAFLILALSLYLRMGTFWLPHWMGDQNQYISLAMKLDTRGLYDYNFRHLDFKGKLFDIRGETASLIIPVYNKHVTEGDRLKSYREAGLAYYNEPLHCRAPLFPYLLSWSHKIFLGKDAPYVACNTNLGSKVKYFHPKLIFQAQFWAVIVPLFFNLALILITFFLGLYCFNARVALYSAFIMSTNATSLFLSHKVLTEDTATFFLSLSFLFFLIFFERKNLWGIFLSGLSLGLAILTNQKMGLGLFIVWIYTIIFFSSKDLKPISILKRCLNPYFIIYVLAAILISSFWFIKVTQIYGTPIYMPKMDVNAQTDLSGWFKMISQRHPPAIFFSWDVITLCPVFGLVFLSLINLFRKQKENNQTSIRINYFIIFLWLWVLGFFLYYAIPMGVDWKKYIQEHRYFYPVYPALSILASIVLFKIKTLISSRLKISWLAELITLSLLLWNASWSLPLGMKVVYNNSMLF